MVRGGLGNQLFQYAAGFAQSQIRIKELELDCSLLPNSAVKVLRHSTWPEQLSNFSHEGRILSESRRPRRRAQVKRVTDEIMRHLGMKYPRLSALFGVYSFAGVPSEFGLSEVKNLRTINSYVASISHFEGFEDAVKEQIRNLVNPSKEFLEYEKKFIGVNVTGIHVRLGDYRLLEQIYGEYSTDYLRRCAALLGEQFQTGKIALFSDEPESALKLLNSIGIALDSPIIPRLSAFEELLLLSKCSNIIASNSTFSWWAAYLCENSTAKIFFPRPYYSSSKLPEPKDYLLPDWIQVGR